MGALTGQFRWGEGSCAQRRRSECPEQPNPSGSRKPPPVTPTDLGVSPEEAAKVSGPVLVLPPTATVKSWQYRYCHTGQNHCQDDLPKLLAARVRNGESGDAPYCTDSPTAPPSEGSFVVF